MFMKKWPAVVVILGIVMIGPILSGQLPREGVSKIVRPDLLVEKIEFTTTPGSNRTTNVAITYTMANNSTVASRTSPTEAGKQMWSTNPVTNWMFELVMEKRSYPDGQFHYVGAIQLELGPNARQTGTFNDSVPARMFREYRVRIDAQNWINESNETNNDKTAIWRHQTPRDQSPAWDP
jgi:hypothetical protein